MARPKPSRPTDAELAILNVLWQGGEESGGGMTIRQIAAELERTKTSTYATTQTLVRIMEKKGLVSRGEERYPTVYRPTAPVEVAKGRLLRDFLDRVFDGSMRQLVMHALGNTKASKADMKHIERLIDQMED